MTLRYSKDRRRLPPAPRRGRDFDKDLPRRDWRLTHEREQERLLDDWRLRHERERERVLGRHVSRDPQVAAGQVAEHLGGAEAAREWARQLLAALDRHQPSTPSDAPPSLCPDCGQHHRFIGVWDCLGEIEGHAVEALSLQDRQAMAERLRGARLAAGLGVEELAQRLGYRSGSTIWYWERGRLPRPLARRRLAALLGTTEAVLFAEYVAKREAEMAKR